VIGKSKVIGLPQHIQSHLIDREVLAMSRRVRKPTHRGRSLNSARESARMRYPFIERLEDRTMLDGGVGSSLPAAIVVGRTQSVIDTSQNPAVAKPAYFVGDVQQTNQITITYTVYNEQADSETGVLLTTTLEPGVTIASTSQQPDQNGQNLAWSLGTIQGFDRASVSLTVNLPTTTPMQLDSGAQAFATFDAGAVSAATPAATLRAGNLSDATLLASTPDANTTDPFIQEEAAKLNYDPQKIFDFLHYDVGYNSYIGSVRGARGTLWSLAGNALDVSSLGIALMRASGIPAQYEQGTLSQAQAQILILSMFPAGFQTVGYVPAGTQTSDPANDTQLLSQTESHYWFQFNPGSGMTDADPLKAGATIGQTFTSPTGTFAEVPDNLREKTEITLNAEMYSQAGGIFGALLGGSGLTTSTVLDKTFNDVDLVGRPLSIGNFVSTSKFNAFFLQSTTNTYSPYIAVGDEALPMSQQAEPIRGTDFQEVLTDFPFGSSALTGLFLNVTLSGPNGPSESYDRTLFDRIGFAARQAGGGSVAIDPNAPPALSDLDVFTLNVLPGMANPRPAPILTNEVTQLQTQLRQDQSQGTLPPETATLQRQFMVAFTRLETLAYLEVSEELTAQLETVSSVVAYFARPRLTLFYSRVEQAAQNSTAAFAIDLRRDTIEAAAFPGQNVQSAPAFEFTRGVLENGLEHELATRLASQSAQPATVVSTLDVFRSAKDQGIGLITIGPADLATLDSRDYSAEAKARITLALTQGKSIVVPTQSVLLGGVRTVAWFEVDPTTGESIGVTEDGGHQGIIEYAATLGIVAFVAAPFLLQNYVNANPCKSNPGAGGFLNQPVNPCPALLTNAKAAASVGLVVGLGGIFIPALSIGFQGLFALSFLYLNILSSIDPSLPPTLSDPILLPSSDDEPNQASAIEQAPGGLAAGAVGGNELGAGVQVTGHLTASWSDQDVASFNVSTLNVSVASVRNANGIVVGSGAVTLSVPVGVAATVAGSVAYKVDGKGSLSFYAAAENALGASGNWDSYSAELTGDAAITLSTSGLTLNGQMLPAGSYTITTSVATLGGSGLSAAPNFSGAASVTATGSVVDLEPGGGSITVGGAAVPLANGASLTEYNGTLAVQAGGGNNVESVTLAGNAGSVLSLSATQATGTANQNTPAMIHTVINTSLADRYQLAARAPKGWVVHVDAFGTISATPAPGLQGGTFPIQIFVQSTTDRDLIAQCIVYISITPTSPGLSVNNVVPDSLFTVPFDGAQLPTAFRASIQNLGPAADTYNLTSSNVPSGFALLHSGTSVTVPAGQTGILGLYLQPNAGQPIPPVGSQVSFTVTATSTTDSSITQTKTVTFTVPAIDGVTAAVSSAALTSTSGASVTTTLTLTNVGNVDETVTPSATLPSGVTVSGLAPITVKAGQSATETITLTPDSSVALNSPVDITITAMYGPAASPLTTTSSVSLVVRSAQVVAVQQAASVVSGIPNSQIASNLAELADAMASLQANPTDGTRLNRVQFLLNNLATLLQSDPALATFVTPLQPLQAAANAGDVTGLLSQTAAFFNNLTPTLTQEANQQFTASLSPNEADLSPGQGQTFNLQLTSQSQSPIALTIGTGTLPAGVTAVPGQTQVTLMPGQTLTIPVVMTQTIASTKLFNLEITASASIVPRTAVAFVAIRPATADVLSVTPTPVAANPGDSVAVSASIFNTANATRDLLARVDVLDATGTVVSSSLNIPFSLVPSASPIRLDLGSISTTGLANGLYSTRVSLLTVDGVALPGRTAQSSFEIGSPVSLSVSQSTVSVPPGSSSVSTNLSVTDQLATGTAAPAKFGDIQVFYSAANSFGIADNLDGAVFVIENTSGIDINNGVLTINPPGGTADSFNVGTIPAGGRAIIQPGISDDGGTNHTFFAHTGTLLDESEQGPNADDTSFDFKGTQGVYFLDSGNFTPAATKGPSVDDPNDIVNFLGGPGDNDAPAHDFAPQVVANLFGTFQQPPGLTVEVGYADNLRPNPFFPNPWNGSPNTSFVGGGPSFDAGALRIINNSTNPVTISDVTVRLFDGEKFDLWGSNTIPAGGNLILTQTVSFNFDTSDSGDLPFPQTHPDGETAHAARVLITVNGQVITLLDTGHVLTTGGSDLAAGGGNESQNWRPIGTTGISNPNGSNLAVVVTDGLPATGYNVDPASISPTASTVSASQVVWTPPPLTESVPTDFQLSGTVTNIAPGEVRQISTGSSVVATTFAPDGTPIQTTLPFGPLVVAADHIISLAPPAQSVEHAGTSTFMVTLTNPLSTSETYTLSTQGLDEFSTQLAGSVTVAAGQTTTVPLTVTAPSGVSDGTRGFVVNAQTTEGGTDSAEGQLTVSPGVALPNENVSVALSPTQAVAGPNTAVSYQVIVTNTGDVTTTYNLTGSFPAGFNAAFGATTVTVPPGESNSRTVILTLTPPTGASATTAPFTVTATSTDAPTISGSANGSITVVSNGVQVALTPNSGTPGDTFQMKVTNTGTVQDTFDLSVGGPAGLVANLATNSVTLAPGASQTVPITTAAISFAVPGPIDLTAIATSRGNPSIRAAASAALTVGNTHGLSAQLTPTTKILPIPGGTSFLLLVNNTGNTEDVYQAVITGTTGAVSANLMGLDGNPTQSIPLFRLPGLSTGAILIDASLANLGLGTVSVRVTSQNDPTRTATETATVSALASVATTTRIVVSPSPALVGQLVTITAIVAPAAGSGAPTGNVTFKLDGTAQTPISVQVLNGLVEATFSTATLSPGTHMISASYSGDANFTSSAGEPSTLSVNLIPTSTSLDVSATPAMIGQPLTLTATVTAVTGSPTGAVVFLIDGIAQSPVALSSVGGKNQATLTTSSLSVGQHQITAVYMGDVKDFASFTQGGTQIVSQGTDGPRVTSVKRYGYHRMPTEIVLGFNQALDPARANDLSNYHITGPSGRSIQVASALYDPASDSVTLFPSSLLNFHRTFVLTVNGTAPTGLSSTSGSLLDGRGTGQPGGNYVTKIDRSKLVFGVRTPSLTAITRRSSSAAVVHKRVTNDGIGPQHHSVSFRSR
jgi:uncharacterized membrane protein